MTLARCIGRVRVSGSNLRNNIAQRTDIHIPLSFALAVRDHRAEIAHFSAQYLRKLRGQIISRSFEQNIIKIGLFLRNTLILLYFLPYGFFSPPL